MATNFTNKYMQVFQNYNEFVEHSADYVRGEDHIAFLIEENEVIYWLYLEQVWRPLNVRTTTTGQLEDGRTKVAVRLEYVEGGQKYTSVPNIPDPERITSMSHFLEDYPDIEEVNVSGTVNLTDLSYAFAGSKIKDFSMLNVSNVNNANHFIDNINNPTFDIEISFSPNSGKFSSLYILNVIINSFKCSVNNPQYRPNDDETNSFSYTCSIENSTINDLTIIDNNNGANCGLQLKNSNIINIIGDNNRGVHLYENNNINNINANETTIVTAGLISDNIINIYGNKLTLAKYHDDDKEIDFKIISENDNIIIGHSIFYRNFNVNFGYGIKYKDNANISIRYIERVGNFVFTTPIVDDAFYAKYAQYNTPISIFQYKTTFTEVADINISNAVDSSLVYVDWNSIDFDTSNMSIVINNYMPNDGNGISIQKTFFNLNGKTFNKFILDNDITDENNLPTLCFQNVFFELNTTEFSYISGKYKLMSLGGYATYRHTSMFNNLVLYSDIAVDIKSLNTHPFLTKDNVIIKAPRFIITNVGNSGKIEITNLINDNNELYISYYNSYPYYLIRDTACVLYVSGLLCSFYDWFAGTAVNAPIHIDGETNFYLYITYSNDNYISYYKEKSIIDNLFIECKDNCFIGRIDILEYDTDENIINHGCVVKNIYGIVNVTLPYYVNVYNAGNIIYNEDTFESIHHIDINSSRCIESNSFITSFKNLDNETLINLITKLIDNTSSSIKTIYMYRSQSNIIGEENIAAAVAKNYEFAIIEN